MNGSVYLPENYYNSMSVLFYGTGLILIAFFIHLIIWKIRRPENETRALLQIFFGTLIVSTSILCKLSPCVTIFGIPAPTTNYEYLQLCFFFISVSLAYIATYSVLEVDSPSLVIVMNIARAGSKGLDRNSLEQKMGDDVLIIPRVRDLVAAGMVYLDGEAYRIKPKGALLVRIFVGYRELLKKTQKGG